VPFALAVSNADFEELTAEAVAVKLALAEPAGMETFDGIESAEVELVRFTVTPALGAPPFRVIVH